MEGRGVALNQLISSEDLARRFGTRLEIAAAHQASLKIVIVDENPIRAAVLEDAPREAGHANVVRLDDLALLAHH